MSNVFSQTEQQFLIVWAFVFAVFVVATVLAHLALVGRRK